MSLNRELNRWIAESESWQSFIDFRLPSEERADYPFLKRWDDFFISLMSSGFDLLSAYPDEVPKDDFVSVAKGLIIYSLDGKSGYFSGVNISENILFAAGYYYLGGFPASAFLLSRTIPVDEYDSDIDLFLTGFLRRQLIPGSMYSRLFKRFLDTGNPLFLRRLRLLLLSMEKRTLENGGDYASYKLAVALIRHFASNNIWHDLLGQNNSVDVWQRYVDRNLQKSVPIWSFFPSQRKAINTGLLTEGTFSLQMPTSAGKTYLSELLIYHAHKVNSENKVLYLAPFRSLASELRLTLGKSLGMMGISVKSIYGGHLPSKEEQEAIQSVDVLIATPEKLMAVEDMLPNLFDSFKTIICDEGHLLDDENRGLSYELLLSRLKSSSVEGRRFVFMSAIIPNIATINSWLGGNSESLIESDYRPTQLEFAFLRKRNRGNVYDLDVNPLKAQPENYQLYRFLIPSEQKYYNHVNDKESSFSSKKAITTAVALKSVRVGSVAVFCPTKRGQSGVEAIAEEVIRQQVATRNPTSLLEWTKQEVLSDLDEYFSFLFGEDFLLARLVRYGALYHHGDLPQNVREVIEGTLRRSEIRLVICTNTLAEGVNLPIRTMVLHSTTRFDGSTQVPLKVRDLKNLVGRAGRAGKETSGFIIIPHESDFDTIRSVIRDDNIEDVNGWLYELISRITKVLQRNNIELTNEVLDSQNEEFLNWLDSIDTALIDLLAEDVNPDELEELVQQLIQQTLSYAQANENQKRTLDKVFLLRSQKLQRYIEEGRFNVIKNSGSTIRAFERLTDTFDFNDEIWNREFDALDQNWFDYLFTNGVFQMDSFDTALTNFNQWNKANVNHEMLLSIVSDWMSGKWYSEIKSAHDIEMYQLLRLLSGFLGFQTQNIVSSIIRIKMQVSEAYTPPNTIVNWPIYLQNGIRTRLEVALFELGFNDRVIVLELSKILVEREVEYEGFRELQSYLLSNNTELVILLSERIPSILSSRLEVMFNLMRNNVF